jgi:hypothetical protein
VERRIKQSGKSKGDWREGGQDAKGIMERK